MYSYKYEYIPLVQIHKKCIASFGEQCSLGELREFILPPTAILPSVLDRERRPQQQQHQPSSTMHRRATPPSALQSPLGLSLANEIENENEKDDAEHTTSNVNVNGHAHVNGAFEPEKEQRSEQQSDLERVGASDADAGSSSTSEGVRPAKAEAESSPAMHSGNGNGTPSALELEARSTRTNSLPTDQLPFHLRNGLRNVSHAHEASDTHSSHSDPIGSKKCNGKGQQPCSQLVDANASLAASQQSMVRFTLPCGFIATNYQNTRAPQVRVS